MVNNSGKIKHCHSCLPEKNTGSSNRATEGPASQGGRPLARRLATSPQSKNGAPPGNSRSIATLFARANPTRTCCSQDSKPRSMPCWQTAHRPEVCKKKRSKITWYKNDGVIFNLKSGQVDNQATTPSRDRPANPPKALYCPSGAPFGPVHLTEYPPNPAYLEYSLETILIDDPLARTIETEYIGHEGKRIEVPPLLFKDKYNYLPAYFVPMTLP
ncbi:hypothetical protein DSO57_1033151 [Entomophthora muscae]|uniref:Uncharacterized protein n=1 Tax=Entomophthora muscae TaxID=34485 RepID=A0ACC2T0N1_9FUNG|nr:hypothetical protein DSO57_1033151 [Entomophthora muscae]